jgi:NADH:ubiquinone oxidoreductase subunit 4 (subunit M)
MYWLEPAKSEPVPVSRLSRLTMSILIAAIFILGVYPQPIFDALR